MLQLSGSFLDAADGHAHFMAAEADFDRKWLYRALDRDGDEVASAELSDDEDVTAWLASLENGGSVVKVVRRNASGSEDVVWVTP